MSIPLLSLFLSFVATVPALLGGSLFHVAGIKFKMNEYLQKEIKFISLNIKYFVFVVYYIGQKGFACQSILFLFTSLHNVPTSLELVFVEYNRIFTTIPVSVKDNG